jgi:hypothetical protein
MSGAQSKSVKVDSAPNGSRTGAAHSLVAGRTESPAAVAERRIPLGFWIIPFAVIGAAIWVMVLRSVWLWFV